MERTIKKIGDMPALWIKQLLAEEKSRLRELKKHEKDWGKVRNFDKLINLRRNIVEMCQETYNSIA